MTLNTHFDRLEDEKDNHYNTLRGTEAIGHQEYEGFFKCKLVHTTGQSVIVPDLVYIMLNDEDFAWFQFYSFMPNILNKFSDTEIFGTVYVDIAFGHTLQLTISDEWHISNLADNSNLFKCRIMGPENLMDYSTGTGKVIGGIPFIYLYHHTLPATKELILQSANYRGSLWNFQGTKMLENMCYAYFTSLDVIIKPNDLKMIAMANNGTLHLVLDITNEIIPINVYRENTSNRTATLKQLIDATIIPNNHIWRHIHDHNGTIYYEICSPFIYRIGLQPGTTLPFQDERIKREPNIKGTGYMILGDASEADGLIAPFDEEHTAYLFKSETFPDNTTNILKFWFSNGNKDLYSGKKIERQKFKNND
jgi:hypothetical protein